MVGLWGVGAAVGNWELGIGNAGCGLRVAGCGLREVCGSVSGTDTHVVVMLLACASSSLRTRKVA
ncbi:hypothetical protein XcmpCFBP7700_18995 [Xanthomonas campestris]|nr:hypothetical protein XcmpCFBP7700_18995 [Xanthomonas campestris]